MKRALICDWGGVLMRTVDVRPRMAWERRLGLPPGGLVELFFGGDAWQRAMESPIGLEEVWAECTDGLGLSEEDLTALNHDFWAGDRLDEELVALLRGLRAEGVRTALLSNHSVMLAHLLDDLELEGLFDVRLISALEGVMKPDPVVFQRALDRLGVTAAEAVFVDDWDVHVAGARAVGIDGIRFRGLTHLRRALAAQGLPVEPPAIAPVPGIRAVIFDWGGVLSPLTFRRHTRKWEKQLGLAEGALNRILWGSAWKQLEIGAISTEKFDEHIARSLGLADREAVQQFYLEFYADEHIDERVVAAVRALRRRYSVGMLTNAFPNHAELARERYGFDPHAEFDVYVNSAEVGLAKPDPAIYRLVLWRLGVAPGEAMLVDDMVRNTDAARSMGVHTLVFADAKAALSDLAMMLGHPILPGE
jgi:HAD superfamily hydrolase (TIGR01509 family)